jgi:stage II sporulation protein D
MHRLRAVLGMSVIAIAACSDLGPTAPLLSPDDVLRSAAETRSFDGTVRIGVVPSATEITIGAPGSFTIRQKGSDDVILSGSNEDVTIEFESPPVVETAWWVQIVCTGNEAYRDELLALAEDLGYETFTEFVPAVGCWRVRVGTWAEMTWGEWVNEIQPRILEEFSTGAAIRVEMTFAEPATVTVTLDGETVLAELPVVIESEGELVRIDGRLYRGVADVVLNSSGLLAGVNELPLEEYLYGVVPRELPPTVWDQLEAQKAQAVAARTFALSRIGHRAADGYDLLPTTADQVYGGYASEHPLSTQAVDETAGIVATYNGNLISTVYHSTSGGFTAHNEDVWQSGPVAYLRGVPDAERGQALQRNPNPQVFRNASGARSLRGFRGGDYEADWSQYHRWYFEWTAEEISRSISAFAGTEVGTVHEINVLSRSESGRVYEIEFVTDEGTFTEEKDRIRWALQFVNAQGNLSPLLSTLFLIEPISEQSGPRGDRAVVGFQAWGGGWGHGIGMSQTGAAGMAERGRTFDEILRHYYTGIELETRTY